jgi:hypothetical protein
MVYWIRERDTFRCCAARRSSLSPARQANRGGLRFDGTRTVTKFENAFNIDTSIPANVSSFFEANIERARSSYDGAAAKFKSCADASNKILDRQQAIACQWSGRLMETANTNISAGFDAAEKMAKAKTLKDAATIQTEFIQAQTQRVIAQSQDAVALAVKEGTEAFAIWTSLLANAAAKAV